MTKADLIKQLRALHGDGDQEINHAEADKLLLLFINDAEVTAAFDAIEKWYA
jgi:hypothetical protein